MTGDDELEDELVSIKLMYADGVMEDVRSGMVMVKHDETMSYAAKNMLPHHQMLLCAITLHQLYLEYLQGFNEDADKEFASVLMSFIKGLLDVRKLDKGDVLQ